MGLGPTHRAESCQPRRPRAGGDPRGVDSRLRGNELTFDGVPMGQRPTHGNENPHCRRPRAGGDPRCGSGYVSVLGEPKQVFRQPEMEVILFLGDFRGEEGFKKIVFYTSEADISMKTKRGMSKTNPKRS